MPYGGSLPAFFFSFHWLTVRSHWERDLQLFFTSFSPSQRYETDWEAENIAHSPFSSRVRYIIGSSRCVACERSSASSSMFTAGTWDRAQRARACSSGSRQDRSRGRGTCHFSFSFSFSFFHFWCFLLFLLFPSFSFLLFPSEKEKHYFICSSFPSPLPPHWPTTASQLLPFSQHMEGGRQGLITLPPPILHHPFRRIVERERVFFLIDGWRRGEGERVSCQPPAGTASCQRERGEMGRQACWGPGRCCCLACQLRAYTTVPSFTVR